MAKNILISYFGFEQDEFDCKANDPAFIKRFGPKIEKAVNDVPVADRTRDHKLRLEIWRPSVALAKQPYLRFDDYYLIYNTAKDVTPQDNKNMEARVNLVKKDIEAATRGKTKVHLIDISLDKKTDAWELSKVYTKLYEVFRRTEFHPVQKDNYKFFVNCNNGSMQVRESLFLLVQQRQIDAVRIIPTFWKKEYRDSRSATADELYDAVGSYALDDPREFQKTYADLAAKLAGETNDTFKKGISTQNKKYLKKLALIQKVALNTNDPILFTGATGSGKTQLAHNISKMRAPNSSKAPFIRANCSAFAGDPALARSQLFGYSKNAFSGAGDKDHAGLLEQANGGVLFLDEIGELPKDVQAMLLTAIENGDDGKKHFERLGDNKTITSDFMLICGTNHNLWNDTKSTNGREPTFRQDLLERISVWHFELPSLADRRDDLEINCTFALQSFSTGHHARQTNATQFTPDALTKFVKFGQDPKVKWEGNFREFNAMVWRMATLAEGDAITVQDVEAEIKRWRLTREYQGRV